MKRILLMTLVLVITGCSAQKNPTNNFNNANVTSACATNVYLKRYGCSAERVQQAAEQGDPDAQYALGYMYYYGIGITSDPQTAQQWINKAAAQGQPLAEQALRIMKGGNSTLAHISGQVGTRAHQPTSLQSAGQSVATKARVQPQRLAVRDVRLQSGAKPNSTQAAAVSRAHPSHALSAGRAAILSKHSLSRPVHIARAQHQSVPSGYTLQLMGTHQLADIKLFISRHKLSGNLSVFETRYGGKPWYSLVYGNYPDMWSAKQALKKLPLVLRRQHPWVKSFKTIEQEVKQHRVLS